MPFLDENGLEQVLNGIKDNTLPFTEDLVFDEDKKLTEIVMGNVKTSMDVNGWTWTETDDYTSVDENTYVNDTSNADYIYEYVPKQIVYSMNEVNTGNVWIDGKPIYRQVYSWTGTLAAETTIGNLPENVDMIISVGGTGYFPTLNRIYPYCFCYYNNESWELGVQCNLDDGIIKVQQGTSLRVEATVNIILEYTKTTDTI